MERKINLFSSGRIPAEKFSGVFQGWSAHANLGNNHDLVKN